MENIMVVGETYRLTLSARIGEAPVVIPQALLTSVEFDKNQRNLLKMVFFYGQPTFAARKHIELVPAQIEGFSWVQPETAEE